VNESEVVICPTAPTEKDGPDEKQLNQDTEAPPPPKTTSVAREKPKVLYINNIIAQHAMGCYVLGVNASPEYIYDLRVPDQNQEHTKRLIWSPEKC